MALFECGAGWKAVRHRSGILGGRGPPQPVSGAGASERLHGAHGQPWSPASDGDGEVLVGTVEYRPDSIVFPTRLETDKGIIELRATWTRTGPNSYRVAQSQRAGEAWKPLWAMELKRKREG
jgi:hypothetical protein